MTADRLTGRRRRAGMALLIVLVLIMMVALSAYGFALSMQNQYRLSRVSEDQAQSRLAALSGAELVAAILEQSAEQRAALGSLQDNPDLFRSIAVEPQAKGVSEQSTLGLWRASVLSPRPVSSFGSQQGSDIATPDAEGLGHIRFGLQNESAKIHIPTLANWDRMQPGYARKVLASLPGANEIVVDAWLQLLNGRPCTAEQHEQRNRLWLGGDLNQNYRPDPIESLHGSLLADGDTSDAARVMGQSGRNAGLSGGTPNESAFSASAWQQYLTWHSGARNENFSGRRRVYLNDPDLQELHRQLVAIWPVEWANFVVVYRQYGPSIRVGSNRRPSADSSGSDSSSELAGFAPDFSVPAAFNIQSALELIGVSIRLPSDRTEEGGSSTNRQLQSPFRDEIASTSDYLSKLLDDVTTSPGRLVLGRIDVNQAPLVVLMAVPGMEQDLAERIIRQRDAERRADESTTSTSDGIPSEATVAWLFEQGLVDLSQLIRLEPYLTARSDVYSCQIIGYKDNNHSVYRCTLTVDARTRPAAIRDFQTWHDWDRGFDISALGYSISSPP